MRVSYLSSASSRPKLSAAASFSYIRREKLGRKRPVSRDSNAIGFPITQDGNGAIKVRTKKPATSLLVALYDFFRWKLEAIMVAEGGNDDLWSNGIQKRRGTRGATAVMGSF
jgi:hypothetical protein